MKKKVLAVSSIILVGVLLSSACGMWESEAKPEPYEYTHTVKLSHAKPYRIICEGSLANEKGDRTVGLWFINSNSAAGFDEYAQTAIQAVCDLYHRYGRDFTSVMLVASDKVRISYATASYAADGKGALGMTGSNPTIDWYWKAQAADRQLTDQELAIAELWSEKQPEFPSKNPLSSSSYDVEALRQYIADTLGITYSDVQLPELHMMEYEFDDRL